MSKRSLRNKISKKLDQLSGLLDNIDEARIINTDDPDTWDDDILGDLISNLKKILQILEDKKHPKEKDPWGDPMIVEEGLCSLIAEYNSEESNSDDE